MHLPRHGNVPTPVYTPDLANYMCDSKWEKFEGIVTT
jgi:hypothetical protein